MRKKVTSLLALTLTAAVALAPGCIFGSPVSAFSGEPYGMTRDDWSAIGGARPPIWGGHPVFAAMDLPFAFVLDTGFLPIALIVWGIKALGDGDDDHDHGPGADHTHEGDADHDHQPDDEQVAPARDPLQHLHGDGYQHTHEGGDLPHSHDSD
jgi:uncharacterized protein YceK